MVRRAHPPAARVGSKWGAVALVVPVFVALAAQACIPGDGPGWNRDGGGSGDGGIVSGDGGSGGDGGVGAPAQLAPATYVAKVKNLLTGLAASQTEVDSVVADPTQLRTLVTTWMKTPGYQQRMIDFFTLAFEQGDVTSDELTAQSFAFADIGIERHLLANLRESFGRTAMEIVNEGHPFTETMTTQRFMMTPPMMMYLALVDEHHTGDNGGVVETYYDAHPGFHFTLSKAVVPLSQSVDPTSPNYLSFTTPQFAGVTGACGPDTYTIDATNDSIFQKYALASVLFTFMLGQGVGPFNMNGTYCAYPTVPTAVTASDFNAWRMITVRQPKSGESPSTFFDLPNMHTATELVTNTPRVGFYTTPAFLGTWNTNASNQARVTTNQTLIVGLGHAFDGLDTAMPQSLAALDKAHAVGACIGCHQTLDPMRQFFRNTYTLSFSTQDDKTQQAMPGQFAFDGVSMQATRIGDFGAQMAAHPRFANAWTQKLCTWANAGPCAQTDAEFIRISAAFASSSFDWNTLVTELFTSPLITYARPITSPTVFPVAKRAQTCALLSARLGIADVCSLQAATVTPAALVPVKVIATILPSDQYGRGATVPTQANDPGLFFRSGMENVCVAVANVAVDAGTSSHYQSAAADAALDDLVHNLMNLTSPRDAAARTVLATHFANAKASGASATDALKSTFVLACMSPTVVGIGE